MLISLVMLKESPKKNPNPALAQLAQELLSLLCGELCAERNLAAKETKISIPIGPFPAALRNATEPSENASTACHI